MGSIRIPTVVVVGDRDLMTPVNHARALAAAIPGARLEVLPGCGHMVMLERRRELNHAILGVAGDLPAAVGGGGGRRG